MAFHNPFLVVSLSSLRFPIKYHPLRLEPRTAMLYQDTLMNYFIKCKLMPLPPYITLWNMNSRRTGPSLAHLFRKVPENLLGLEHYIFAGHLNEWIFIFRIFFYFNTKYFVKQFSRLILNFVNIATPTITYQFQCKSSIFHKWVLFPLWTLDQDHIATWWL